MKNVSLKLTILIAVIALMAVPAFASTIVLGGSGATATINLQGVNPGYSAQVTFTMLSGNQMKIDVTNTGAAGSKLFSLGFNTTPNITGTSGVTSNVSGWNICNNGQCGLGSLVEIAFGGGGNSALMGGQSGSITFTFSPGAPINIDATYAHMGGLPPNSEKITETQVPEPASLVLLGSGLLSAGGFIRRKFGR